MTDQLQEFKQLVGDSQKILVLQPEKPDTDSLTSSLALEQILGDLGKEVILFCRDKLPGYISYFEGADRVSDDFPNAFDMTILVDTGGPQQVARTLEKYRSRLSAKPFVIIDHHPTRTELGVETLTIVDPEATSTCEVVANIARQLKWEINSDAASLIIPGVLADTRNLAIPTVMPETFEIIAEMMRLGGDVYKSHLDYWDASALSPELLALKGRLLSRIEMHCDGKIAVIVVTPEELKTYAEMHDPSDLVIYDMQGLKSVAVAVVIRHYNAADGNKLKVSTRGRMPVAGKTCEHFGGGGHDRAAGCQATNVDVDEFRAEFVRVLCENVKNYETLQHTQSK